jgi:hypothetical protein
LSEERTDEVQVQALMKHQGESVSDSAAEGSRRDPADRRRVVALRSEPAKQSVGCERQKMRLRLQQDEKMSAESRLGPKEQWPWVEG